jgi:hypothetical protein
MLLLVVGYQALAQQTFKSGDEPFCNQVPEFERLVAQPHTQQEPGASAQPGTGTRARADAQAAQHGVAREA